MDAFWAFFIVIIILSIYHFGMSIILGMIKELIFLFVKNKKKNRFYLYYDYIVPMILTAIPIIVIPIIGLFVIFKSLFSDLFSYEALLIFLLFLVEVKFFTTAYSEYKVVKESHKQTKENSKGVNSYP